MCFLKMPYNHQFICHFSRKFVCLKTESISTPESLLNRPKAWNICNNSVNSGLPCPLLESSGGLHHSSWKQIVSLWQEIFCCINSLFVFSLFWFLHYGNFLLSLFYKLGFGKPVRETNRKLLKKRREAETKPVKHQNLSIW